MASPYQAMNAALFPESEIVAEAITEWLWRTYGATDSWAIDLAITDMNKIADGVPVERWGCPFEVMR